MVIRIGAIDYDLLMTPNLFDGYGDDEVKVNGVLRGHVAELDIEALLPNSIKFVALWHEAIHAILNQAGIIDHTEETVIALGYGVAGVLRDNDFMRKPFSDV